ncbi:conserved hypothetical protein [Ricinus communis]|uniref:Uncharacterized protein n=1 Tax=Ricinus communis TaxID=3988 RepID=B9REK1_RICCO|nr:conserved hypothetical protein [Ricinus communis]
MGTNTSSPSLDNAVLHKTGTTSASNQQNFKENEDGSKQPWSDHCNRAGTHGTCWKTHGKPAYLKNGKSHEEHNRAFQVREEGHQKQVAPAHPPTWDLLHELVNQLKSTKI